MTACTNKENADEDGSSLDTAAALSSAAVAALEVWRTMQYGTYIATVNT